MSDLEPLRVHLPLIRELLTNYRCELLRRICDCGDSLVSRANMITESDKAVALAKTLDLVEASK